MIVYQDISLAQLCRKSTLIIEGKITKSISQEIRYDDIAPFTYLNRTVKVLSILKGTCGNMISIEPAHTGTNKDMHEHHHRLGMSMSPLLERFNSGSPPEHAIFFLKKGAIQPYQFVAQGAFLETYRINELMRTLQEQSDIRNQ